MNFGWIYARDTILMDEDFQKKIDEALRINKVPLGSTILLAARDFKVRDGYTFHLGGYDLMILSDRLDGGANGTIALIGGIDSPGQKLTVACKQLIAIHLRSKGGQGRQGRA